MIARTSSLLFMIVSKVNVSVYKVAIPRNGPGLHSSNGRARRIKMTLLFILQIAVRVPLLIAFFYYYFLCNLFILYRINNFIFFLSILCMFFSTFIQIFHTLINSKFQIQ